MPSPIYSLRVILKIFAYVYISNINEVIRSVLNFFIFFFRIRFHKYKKAQKRIQGTKKH